MQEENISIPEHELLSNIKLTVKLSKKVTLLKQHLFLLKRHKELRISSNKTTDILIQETSGEIRSYTKKIAELLRYNYRDKLIIPDEFWYTCKEIEDGVVEFDTPTKNKMLISLATGLVIDASNLNDTTDSE